MALFVARERARIVEKLRVCFMFVWRKEPREHPREKRRSLEREPTRLARAAKRQARLRRVEILETKKGAPENCRRPREEPESAQLEREIARGYIVGQRGFESVPEIRHGHRYAARG